MSVCKNPKENCMRYPSAWVMRFADELPARARVLGTPSSSHWAGIRASRPCEGA